MSLLAKDAIHGKVKVYLVQHFIIIIMTCAYKISR